jgi:hypothetical protein
MGNPIHGGQVVPYNYLGLPTESFYLDLAPRIPQIAEDTLRQTYHAMSDTRRIKAIRLSRELAQRDDPTVNIDNWGDAEFWANMQRAALVIKRVGKLDRTNLSKIDYCIEMADPLPPDVPLQQYFYYSLQEKAHQDLARCRISYVNGMGMCREAAGYAARQISEQFAHSNNLHCVYLPTHQRVPFGDQTGLAFDGARYGMVKDGGYTRTSLMIAQQWIDYLDDPNPTHAGRIFLQICYSEGAAHTWAALNLLRQNRSDLVSRLRIVALCPAKIITPNADEPLQVINLIKWEDPVPTTWDRGQAILEGDNNREKGYIYVVPHTVVDGEHGNPHDPLSPDYIEAARPYFDRFFLTTNITTIQEI